MSKISLAVMILGMGFEKKVFDYLPAGTSHTYTIADTYSLKTDFQSNFFRVMIPSCWQMFQFIHRYSFLLNSCG